MARGYIARFPLKSKESSVRWAYQVKRPSSRYAMWTRTMFRLPTEVCEMRDTCFLYWLDSVTFTRCRIEVEATGALRPYDFPDCLRKLFLDNVDFSVFYQPAFAHNVVLVNNFHCSSESL